MIYDAVYTFVSLTMHFQDLGIKNKKREHVGEKIISWSLHFFIGLICFSSLPKGPKALLCHWDLIRLILSRLNQEGFLNAAAQLVFNESKNAHVTPLFVSLHWLPVAARIKFKTLMLAYRTATGSAPTYFHSLLRIYIPSRSLRSASERRLVVPSQRGSKSLSRTFSFTVPGRWNAGSLSTFKQQLKTHLFQRYLTSS